MTIDEFTYKWRTCDPCRKTRMVVFGTVLLGLMITGLAWLIYKSRSVDNERK